MQLHTTLVLALVQIHVVVAQQNVTKVTLKIAQAMVIAAQKVGSVMAMVTVKIRHGAVT